MEFLFLKQTLSDNFFPVLGLIGSDIWLKSRSLKIIEQSLDIQNAQMNVITLENPKSIDDIMSVACTDCFFSNQKLIIVEDFVFPQGQAGQKAKEQITRFANSNQNFCCLVFVTIQTDPKQLDFKGVTLVNCNHLSKNDVVRWICAFASKQQRAISTQTANLLSEYCLCDMARISIEIQKLCDFATEQITADMVEQLVTKDTEFLIFDLGRAIAGKNNKRTYEMVKSFLSSGQDVRSLFSVLYNYFRRLYYIRTTGLDTQTLAEHFGVKTGAIGFLKEFAQKYKPMQLKTALSHFRACDTMLKQFYNETDTFYLLINKLLAI